MDTSAKIELSVFFNGVLFCSLCHIAYSFCVELQQKTIKMLACGKALLKEVESIEIFVMKSKITFTNVIVSQLQIGYVILCRFESFF